MASQYKVVLGTTVLCDDAATPKVTGITEQLNGSASVQVEDIYASGNKLLRPQGNVAGQFVFTAGCSFASMAASATAWKTAYGLLNTQDTVVLTYGGTTLTMANAVLKDVQRVLWDGLRLSIRYTFLITTIT